MKNPQTVCIYINVINHFKADFLFVVLKFNFVFWVTPIPGYTVGYIKRRQKLQINKKLCSYKVKNIISKIILR